MNTLLNRQSGVRAVLPRVVGRGLVAGFAASLLLAGGCGALPSGPEARAIRGLPAGGASGAPLAVQPGAAVGSPFGGYSSDQAAVVFDGARVASVMRNNPGMGQPERMRNNATLGYRPDVALTAANLWPQPAQPDLTRRRTTTLGLSANQVTTFDTQGPRFGGRTRYSPYRR